MWFSVALLLDTVCKVKYLIPSFIIHSCLKDVKLGQAEQLYSYNGIFPHQFLNHVDKWEYYSLLKICTWLNVGSDMWGITLPQFTQFKMTRIQIRQRLGWLIAQGGINSWNVKQPGWSHLPWWHHCSAVQLFISVKREWRHMPLTFLSPYANKALLMIFGEFYGWTFVHTMLSELGRIPLITAFCICRVQAYY